MRHHITPLQCIDSFSTQKCKKQTGDMAEQVFPQHARVRLSVNKRTFIANMPSDRQLFLLYRCPGAMQGVGCVLGKKQAAPRAAATLSLLAYARMNESQSYLTDSEPPEKCLLLHAVRQSRDLNQLARPSAKATCLLQANFHSACKMRNALTSIFICSPSKGAL